MNIILINIGDELLIGQVVNTNASRMSAYLNEHGMAVRKVLTVADDEREILSALTSSIAEADAVIITGGLGPTKDDITKAVLCRFFDTELQLHEPSLRAVEAYFASRGYALSDTNRHQAELPACCVPLSNRWGTAPGMWFEREGRIVVSLPGVPFEMRGLMREEVVPRLQQHFSVEQILHKNILTFGIGESYLSDKIETWELALPTNVRLAYLPADGIVRLRLSARGDDMAVLKKTLNEEIEKLRALIGEYIFGYDDDTLEQVVGRLLAESGKTLSTVESCTGGLIAHKLTSVAGASAYYKGGVVAYANEAKEQFVGVCPETLAEHGAVSRATAEQMAVGCRERFATDFAVATTGIAGPSGGTAEKPVGTVWIAIADATGVEAQCFQFGNDRQRTVVRAANQALRWLQTKICGK